MRRSTLFVALVAAALAGACLATKSEAAQGCRAQQIMASQCTWFALEELRGSKIEAARAQREATSTLIDGCSQGEYQMVLLRGTSLSDAVVRRLQASGDRAVATVRSACAAEAGRVAGR